MVGVAAGAAAGDLGVGVRRPAAGVAGSLEHERRRLLRPGRSRRGRGRTAATRAAGSAFRRDSARRLPNVARPIGETARSQAPATQTSTSPSRSQWRPISSAWLPLAQAAESASAGPAESQPAPDPLDRSTRDPGPGRTAACRPRGGRPPRAASTRPRARAPGRRATRDARPRGPASRSAVSAHQCASCSSGGRADERPRIAPGRARDLSELRGDPAGIVVGREPRHQRHARPPGQQVRLDLRELAAQRRRGPDARDPDRFIPVHVASSRAVGPSTNSIRSRPSGSVAIVSARRLRPVRQGLRQRDQVDRRGRAGETSAPNRARNAGRPPESPAAQPARAPGPGTRLAAGEPATARSGTSSGDQPLRTSQTPGTTPADSQVRAARKPSAAACSPPPTPRFGPCSPRRQADRPRRGMKRKVRDQVRRGAPDSLGQEAPQAPRQVRPPQEPRRGHHAPALERDRGGSPSPRSP